MVSKERGSVNRAVGQGACRCGIDGGELLHRGGTGDGRVTGEVADTGEAIDQFGGGAAQGDSDH